MTDLTCNYCNHIFKNKSNLDKHQKTAKYCIELQKTQNLDIINEDIIDNNFENNIHICSYCNKEFFRKDTLIRHINICKDKNKYEDENKNKIISELKIEIENKNKIISELKIEIENKDIIIYELKNKNENTNKIISELKIEIENKNKIYNSLENITIRAIENSGNKTNIINNNKSNLSIINHLTPLTDSHIREKASLLQTKDILKGAESLAIFARDHSFKDRVICTDVTRRNFIFKDENNNIIKDPKGVKITKKFIENNKPELINLLTQYSLTFYNENNFMDIKHKLEIDHCLDAIRSGDISYNVHKYNNFEKIFTTCFCKFVFNKEYNIVDNNLCLDDKRVLDITEEQSQLELKQNE
jgi:hypothetical protein